MKASNRHVLCVAVLLGALTAAMIGMWAVPCRCTGLGSWETGAGLIENRGQLDHAVRYYAIGGRAAVYFTSDAVFVELKEEIPIPEHSASPRHEPMSAWNGETGVRDHRRGYVVRIDFVDANPNPAIEPQDQLGTRYNYFLGSDPRSWLTDVPAHSAIVYRDLWPGIDLVYRLCHGEIAYEFMAAPGTGLEAARFAYQGVERVVAQDGGILRLETRLGTLVDTRPSVSGSGGTISLSREPVAAEPDVSSAYGASSLVWSTLLGESQQDRCSGLDLDASGRAVIAGYTESLNFPTTPGAYDDSTNGGIDAFVSKFGASGSTLLWSTFLGGGVTDVIDEVAVDPSGDVVVLGSSNSSDFPTTAGAYDESHNGARDIVVGKLDSSGSALLWSTYLGGTGIDGGRGLCLDAQANVIVTGEVESSDFPTTSGAYDQSFNGQSDVIVAKLNSGGSDLMWSTFLGGGGLDQPNDVAVAQNGVVVAGHTRSIEFPTTPGAFDTTYDAPRDGFVARLDSSGGCLLWSTLLGGEDEDWINGLVMDSEDNPVVCGRTTSDDFPTTPGAYDREVNYAENGFVAKIDASGGSLIWCTFLHSSSGADAEDITIDGDDRPVVTGCTYCPGIATTSDAYQAGCGGEMSGFVIWLNPSGSDADWATHIGGSATDLCTAVALDASENPVVAGYTCSNNFPTTPGAYDRTYAGIWDAFALQFSLNRSGVGGTQGLAGALVKANRPNPFGHATGIEYELASPQWANLSIYDVRGKLVRVLVDGPVTTGTHTTCWDGCDGTGRQVRPGVYLYRLTAGGETQVGKAVLVQ
jgi:hypothetical protein